MAFILGAALLFAIFIGIALRVSWGVPGAIWLGMAAFIASQYRKKRRGAMTEALRNAGYLFGKHRASLV